MLVHTHIHAHAHVHTYSVRDLEQVLNKMLKQAESPGNTKPKAKPYLSLQTFLCSPQTNPEAPTLGSISSIFLPSLPRAWEQLQLICSWHSQL